MIHQRPPRRREDATKNIHAQLRATKDLRPYCIHSDMVSGRTADVVTYSRRFPTRYAHIDDERWRH